MASVISFIERPSTSCTFLEASLPQHEKRHPWYQNRCATRRRKCLITNEDPKGEPRELNACVEVSDTESRVLTLNLTLWPRD